MTDLYRGWINQPSKQQPLHDRHGENVLVSRYSDLYSIVWLLSGPIVSMVVPSSCLSRGWKE